MATKYISVDGFKELKSIDKGNRNHKNNNKNSFIHKLFRFTKRAFREHVKDLRIIKKKIGSITWSTLTFKKAFKGIRKFHIPSSYFEFMRTPKGIATVTAPVAAAVMLVLTICFWTCSDKPLTVSIDGEYIATIDSDAVLTQASASLHSALSGTDSSDVSTPVIQVAYPTFYNAEKSNATDVYEKLIEYSDAVVSGAGGLYVDGEFYGAAEDAAALSDGLTAILDKAKVKYDDTTTTTFNNSVEVVTGVYPTTDIKTVDEIIESARDSFSIRLETDLMVSYELGYSTIYEYDDSQPDNYSEVTREGVNGKQNVYYRLVYIDGCQVDAEVVDTAVIEEPVDQIMVVGTQESYTGSGYFTWPVPSSYMVTSLFEYRWGSFHSGIDISGYSVYGADIVAADSGVVTWAGIDNSGYGYYVIIDHQNGYSTLYAHASELYVSTGEFVSSGERIASVGSTGYSTGPHLHFEIWENGTKVDPLAYVGASDYFYLDC